MSEANSYQVGGQHYKTNYEHWDLCIRIGLDYLSGTATKYLARYQKSGKALQDLQKAKHYVEKLLENVLIAQPLGRRHRHWVQQEVGRFCQANDIVGTQRHLFFKLCTWEVEADLIMALDQFVLLVQAEEPVPLTDSNKHADRAEAEQGHA